MSRQSHKSEMAKRFENNALIENAFNEAARQAAVEHKHAGIKMVGWSNGQIVEFDPDEILNKPKPSKKRSKAPRRATKVSR